MAKVDGFGLDALAGGVDPVEETEGKIVTPLETLEIGMARPRSRLTILVLLAGHHLLQVLRSG